MNFWELILLGFSVAMDAFAASVCKGLSSKQMSWRKALVVGLYFGGFQALMPLLGFWLGKGFSHFITDYDHWLAFILLGAIGINMIREAIFERPEDMSDDLKAGPMIMLAFATSIDALALGVTFAFLNVNIYLAILIIGIITFAMSILGFKIGNRFGAKFRRPAEILGGLILFFLGLMIFLQHSGVL